MLDEIALRSEARGAPPHRRKELDYYTVNCRSVGNQAALVAGFAYSGIRYHYLLEHQAGWHLSQQNSIEEVIFLTLLTLSMGCGLQARRLTARFGATAQARMHAADRFTHRVQAVVLAMSVSIMAPALALRGPDGSLHDAILGMQKWTSFVIILFLSSLLLYAAAPTIAFPPATGHFTRHRSSQDHYSALVASDA